MKLAALALLFALGLSVVVAAVWFVDPGWDAGLAKPVSMAQPTPQFTTYHVTDYITSFGYSEAEVLAPKGTSDYLPMGCEVEVLKTTDRAARVMVTSPVNTCLGPGYPGLEHHGRVGWVSKSAIDPE